MTISVVSHSNYTSKANEKTTENILLFTNIESLLFSRGHFWSPTRHFFPPNTKNTYFYHIGQVQNNVHWWSILNCQLLFTMLSCFLFFFLKTIHSWSHNFTENIYFFTKCVLYNFEICSKSQSVLVNRGWIVLAVGVFSRFTIKAPRGLFIWFTIKHI